MDKKELTALVADQKITLSDVIDVVIELNGIVGVGLISLGEDVEKYIVNKLERKGE